MNTMREGGFILQGEPIPKGRPRSSVRTRADGTPYPHVYTPERTAHAEREVGWAFKAANPGWEPLTGGVTLDCHFVCRRPDSDWDNLAKLVADALNSIAWVDDAQILEAVITIERGPDLIARSVVGVRGYDVG